MTITEPGLYADIPEAIYHADTDLAPELGRSLSVSGAKKILESPARFQWERDNPPTPRDAFDIGTAAHTLILGTGQPFEAVEVDDRHGKAWTEPAEEIRSRGAIPLPRKQYDAVHNMAAKVAAHPLSSAMLTAGKAEQSGYWIDKATGVTRRARFDWLRADALVDVKTAADASPAGFAKAAANYGYDMQAAWYMDGVEALTGERLPFYFLVVEKEPPHLVAVYTLDEFDLAAGADRNAHALTVFAECESTGHWPGYSDQVETLTLPRRR